LLGALAATVANIARAEVGRALRFVDILLGLAILAAPWVLSGATPGSRANDLAAVLLIAATLPRGAAGNRYGGWDRYII
jgi:hypothetical protein